MKVKIDSLARRTALLSVLAVSATHAQVASTTDETELNLIGLGIASVPDFMGSSKNRGAAVPILRYQFSGSNRYFRWIGPDMELNVLDDRNWRVGPMLTYRSARDDDVDDRVVKRMDELDSEVEAGLFVEYRYKLSEEKLHQIVFNLHATSGSEGTIGGPKVVLSYPYNPDLTFNIGVGADFANGEWMRHYFGITSAQDIALYPSLRGRPFDASGGAKGVYLPFGATYAVNEKWMMSFGGRYEKLASDAKDSPIVDQRGDDSQFTAGLAVMYRIGAGP